MKIIINFCFALACFFPQITLAEDLIIDHSHDHAAQNIESPRDYYSDVMATMHNDMAIEPTGNVDADFMLGMIPHHRGAVAMAEVVMKHGSDEEVRALAQQVITTQQAEIKMMEEWLTSNGYETQ